jgi:hypothetical protein
MNWEAVGAVGEILGAIAVLVTLIYLATQIKQHTLATRAVTNSMGASDDPALISRARMLEFAWSVERFIFEHSFQQFVDDLLANPD